MKELKMRRTWTIVALAVAVLVLAALAAAPVLARAGDPGSGGPPAVQGQGPGMGWRTGAGTGPGMPGRGNGTGPGAVAGPQGTCPRQADLPSGTLTGAQKATLAAMVEEEKLAHDLYAAFATRYDTAVFDRIAAAETRHLAAVRTVLARYELADPTAGKAAGTFASATLQATYDRLLRQGSASEQAALAVGVTVERDDIAELQRALDGLTAPDVQRLYTHLLTASRMHLTAFQAWQR